MIEIILLLTAALTAGDLVTDSEGAAAPAAAPVASAPAVPEADAQAPAAAAKIESAPAETAAAPSGPEAAPADDDAEWHRVDDQPLRRLAANFVAEQDPDLKAAASLAADDDAPVGARPELGVQFVRSEIRYASQGHEVRMEVLRPDSDQRRPAILILHGASGIGDGGFYRQAAEIFAERGYATFLPHYLAPGRANDPDAPAAAKKNAKTSAKTGAKTSAKTGAKTGAKTAKAAPKDPTPNGSVRAGFDVQERILRDAIEQIAQNPYVDDTRIGVFGMSLGGFHALNLSSRDGRIVAVVNMAGALRGNTMPASNRLAPTLALHGARDSVVPVSRARSLGRYLKEHGIAHDVVIYKDQGHFFRGKAREDAFQRAAAFFAGYLAVPSASATVRSRAGTDQ